MLLFLVVLAVVLVFVVVVVVFVVCGVFDKRLFEMGSQLDMCCYFL